MKYFAVYLMLLFSGFAVNLVAQSEIQLKISDVSVNAQSVENTKVEPLVVSLTERLWSEWITLFQSDTTTIKVRYRIKGWNSVISSHKDAGITMRIEYVCTYNGQVERKKIVRSFFAGDSRQFKEKQLFYFNKGLYNKKVELSYTGSLPK